MSKLPILPLKYWVGALLARKTLQPAWRALNALSYWGLGYNNWISTVNGEDRFVSTWAARNSARLPIVFDVGPNEGDTTAKFLEAAPNARCHLFEPSSNTFERLARRFGGHGSVTLNNKGVGSAPGRLVLHDFNGAGSERASFVGEVFAELMRSDDTKLRHVEVEV